LVPEKRIALWDKRRNLLESRVEKLQKILAVRIPSMVVSVHLHLELDLDTISYQPRLDEGEEW
jgi:hypothetical protein